MTAARTIAAALASSGLVPLEAKLLLAHVVGRDRAWLTAHATDPLDREQQARFESLVRRRCDGEPIAYLTGRREFYGLALDVTPAVLIPRPESELLVDFALETIALDAPARVVDLGTGSGAIALALAHARPMASVLAVDASADALEVARGNARRLGIGNVEWLRSDWYSAVPPEPFDLVLANPPYIGARDPHLSEGDVRFEPRQALTPGDDGLAALRAIVAGAGTHLAAGGWIALEHGYDQAEAVRALLAAHGYADALTRRDLAGIPRMTAARRD